MMKTMQTARTELRREATSDMLQTVEEAENLDCKIRISLSLNDFLQPISLFINYQISENILQTTK